jgi:hypothetical protein
VRVARTKVASRDCVVVERMLAWRALGGLDGVPLNLQPETKHLEHGGLIEEVSVTVVTHHDIH